MKRMACALALAAGTGVFIGPTMQSASADPTFAKLANGLQLSLASPASASTDSPVNLDVNFRGGAIKSVELFVDGSRVFKQSVKTTDTHGNFSLKIDNSLLPEGDHEIMIVATEADGSTATSNLKLHVSGPEVSGIAQFTYPRRNAMVQNVVPIEIKMDPGISAPYVAYLLDNEFLSIRNYAPYIYNWDSSKISDGPHTITVEVYDSRTQELLKKMTTQVIVKNVGGFTNIQTKTPTVSASPSSSAIKDIIGAAVSEPVAKLSEEVSGISHSSNTVSTYSLRGSEPGSITLTAARSTQPAPIIVPTAIHGEFAVADPSSIATGMAPRVARIPGGRPLTANLPELIAEPEVGVSAVVEALNVSHTGIAPRQAGNVAAKPRPSLTVPTLVRPMLITPYLTPPVAYIRSHRVNGIKSLEIAFNNSRIAFDVKPRMEHGMALAPFRAIFEHSGGSVRWYGKSQTIRAISANRQIEFKIGDRMARVNNRLVKLAHAPYVENGRTIVPLSFVGDAMNVKVTYDARNSYMNIEGKPRE